MISISVAPVKETCLYGFLNRGGTSALIMAVGFAETGIGAGRGLVKARQVDRFVTVRGLSERERQVDSALWPLALYAADKMQLGLGLRFSEVVGL